MKKKLFVLILLLSLPFYSFAIEATRIRIDLQNAESIDLVKDYINISLLAGYISDKDSFWEGLFGNNDKFVITSTINSVLSSNETLTSTYTYQNEDMGKQTGRPWGISRILLRGMPAEASTDINLRVLIDESSRLDSILQVAGAADSGAAVTLNVFNEVSLGRSRLLADLLNEVLGLNSDEIPFVFTQSVKLPDVVSNGSMNEHLLVLIAPNKDNDRTMASFDSQSLSYESSSGQLKLGDDIVADHSWAVLQISKAPSPNIVSETIRSNAPWAVVAKEYLFSSLPVADNEDQLDQYSQSKLAQLSNLSDLLKEEKRFNAFSQAVALRIFCDEVIKLVEEKERDLMLSDTSGLRTLKMFESRLVRIFGLNVGGSNPISIQLENAIELESRNYTQSMQSLLRSL